MATQATQTTQEPILTLPVDLLKRITDNLDAHDEKALKLTCKRLNLLVACPPPAHQFLATHENDSIIVPPPRDGRSTPLPQAPMPLKQAETLYEIEQENQDVEERERGQGMDLSDTEDGYHDCTEDERSVVEEVRPKKYKHRKNILNWTTTVDSAPGTPGVSSPTAGSFADSRPGTPGFTAPIFTVPDS